MAGTQSRETSRISPSCFPTNSLSFYVNKGYILRKASLCLILPRRRAAGRRLSLPPIVIHHSYSHGKKAHLSFARRGSQAESADQSSSMTESLLDNGLLISFAHFLCSKQPRTKSLSVAVCSSCSPTLAKDLDRKLVSKGTAA